MAEPERRPIGPIRNAIAAIGAAFIYLLLWLLGRKVDPESVPWLVGPVGRDYIGDHPYEDVAREEGLELVRDADEGGLIPDFSILEGPELDAGAVGPDVRDFYEQTARYRMDVWAQTSFPANLALWLLVTTISRKVNQLNFPLRALETAKGMESEIVHLRDAEGKVRYAGWYRRLSESKRVIYTGFYMTEKIPGAQGRCVKVVFPMPQGNATVLLAPRLSASGELELSSDGKRFGDVGFYRVRCRRDGTLRVWYIRSLKEHFRVYSDQGGVLRCDHKVRFLGFPVLHLHYRIERAQVSAAGATKAAASTSRKEPAPAS